LHLESAHNTFFNFTASHDGIGVRPLEGILPPEEIESLVKVVTANNGQVSYKRNPDGSESPYELNITYVDAILGDFKSDNAERFLASQAIQYVLPGVPATYIHSLLGSRNWIEGVHQTGRARTINRAKLVLPDLLTQLNDPSSFRARVFYPYLKMIQVRRNQPAFDPKAGFEILEMDNRIFAIKRFSQNQTIYAVTNICGDSIPLALPEKDLPETMTDLIGAQQINPQSFVLEPYQYVWLAAKA
jgi:sucrose phosphorylase